MSNANFHHPLYPERHPSVTDESLPPIPPGHVLRTQFMDTLQLGPTQLADDIRVPVNRITDILSGRRRISAQTALLLGAYFRTSPEFWMRLQMEYDLRSARRDRRTAAKLMGLTPNRDLEPGLTPPRPRRRPPAYPS
ncbi:HigA family addiction module antidote protein [Spiribacter sp. 2438]|uniref:HigA family addiction module antitoxin n=1 Tax=Spiribacter sp. 2438 TaxID=2666185 RepID=UPI0012B1471D|nr:HigA family addiction module antitoxin [Spiribacter sp. 2438]QGM22355.1 HigA family addiction module antidote protein [Spiribacter sp. 2438]